jgi:hypothetical protein
VAWDGRAWLLLGTSAPNIIGKLEHLGGLAFTSDDAAIAFEVPARVSRPLCNPRRSAKLAIRHCDRDFT